jgi:6,7-dimethyl-8-ribityllumazine synthase
MPRVYEGHLTPPKGRFALCVARFNGFITDELLKGAQDALLRHGVADDDIDVFRVPGTFELSGLVRKLAGSEQYAGIVALGCVIRGGTPHFDYVASEVAKGVGQVAFSAACAVSFGVLTCDTVEQAVDRAGVKAGNKGADAAVACLEMANLHAKLPGARPVKLATVTGKKK